MKKATTKKPTTKKKSCSCGGECDGKCSCKSGKKSCTCGGKGPGHKKAKK